MDIRTLGQQIHGGKVDAINILSNEGDIYTAEAVIQGHAYTLEADHDHHPLIFHSLIEAKRSFERYTVPIRLEFREVYDEMISH